MTVQINYSNVPQTMLPYIQSVMNTILSDPTFSSATSKNYTINFASLKGAYANAFAQTTGNNTQNPTTTFNLSLMMVANNGNVSFSENTPFGQPITKPFEITALHEITHVAFPNLTGDTPTGHDNPPGEYLFRTIVLNEAQTLFKETDSTELYAQEKSLSILTNDPAYSNSNIN